MSLINDALKRARHQALEQEADGSVVSYRAVPAHSRNPRRAWLPYLIGGAAVAIVILSLSMLRRDDGPAAELATPDRPSAVSTASQAAVEAAPPPAGDVGESRPRGREEAKSTPAATPPDGPRAEGDQVASPSIVAPGAGAGLEDGRTYLRRVVAKDGDEVFLAGIAYSDTRPNAVINGSIVTPGDMISGFTVVAITPEHVELEADGVRILLTLR